MLKTSTGKATKPQVERFEAIKEDGCIACRMRGHSEVPPEIHHLTDCGRRIGHDASVGLCPWHHRGVLQMGQASRDMEKHYGASLARSPASFHAEFGTDEALLAYQNERIGVTP